MSETWADHQFDLLEAAYDEVPIEAKARIEELEKALNEVAEKWAIVQVNYEDCARRNTLLEVLAHDLWKGLDCGCRCAMYDECKHPYNDECLMAERMAALGLLGGDAS